MQAQPPLGGLQAYVECLAFATATATATATASGVAGYGDSLDDGLCGSVEGDFDHSFENRETA